MSNLDLIEWPKTHRDAAAAEGWELCFCIDSGATQGRWQIFGRGDTVHQVAYAHVLARAKQRSVLHLTALRLVANPAAPGGRTSRKKK